MAILASAAGGPTGTAGPDDRGGEGASLLPLIAYLAVLVALFIAFVLVGVYAVSQPVPRPL